MGTNYYAKIIPTKERKQKIIDLLDKDEIDEAKQMIDDVYGEIRESQGHLVGGSVHIGKRSAGWQFLWDANLFTSRHLRLQPNSTTTYSYEDCPIQIVSLYRELTIEGISEFLHQPNVILYDEYNVKQDVDEFLEMAKNWKGYSADDNPFSETSFVLRNEFTDLLENSGYKLSDDKSEFYYQGLRFSTSNGFG